MISNGFKSSTPIFFWKEIIFIVNQHRRVNSCAAGIRARYARAQSLINAFYESSVIKNKIHTSIQSASREKNIFR